MFIYYGNRLLHSQTAACPAFGNEASATEMQPKGVNMLLLDKCDVQCVGGDLKTCADIGSMNQISWLRLVYKPPHSSQPASGWALVLVPSHYQAHAVPVNPVQTDLQLCYSDSVGQMKLHLTEFHILDVSHLCGLIIKCSVGSWTGVQKNGFCCSRLVDKSSETGIMVQYAEDAVW